MKRLSIALSCLCTLLLGLTSCGEDTPKVEPTNLILTPTAVTLQVGQTQQLTATVEPADQAVTITFASDKPEVATVDAQGLVTAVAEGTAKITASVGALTKECVVTVTAGESPEPQLRDELPLLAFNGAYTNEEIVEYEKSLGRVAGKVPLGAGMNLLDGYINLEGDLTIPAAVYEIIPGMTVIVSFSKENVKDCPKALAMLEQRGFINLEFSVDPDGVEMINGIYKDDPTISVLMYDAPQDRLGTTLEIFFFYQPEEETPSVLQVQDFPSYDIFKTLDVNKIKEYETNLGFRDYDAEDSDEANCKLFFLTKEDRATESNFALVYYVGTPDEGGIFINSQVNFISSAEDLADPMVEEYLALNGFDNNFTMHPEYNNWIEVYDASGKVLCQVFLHESGIGQIQIYEVDKTESFAMRRAKALHNSTLPKARITQAMLMRALH